MEWITVIILSISLCVCVCISRFCGKRTTLALL